MRKLIIQLDDDLDNWLNGQINQSETIRKALRIYKNDISTDTVEGLRKSYKVLRDDIAEGFDRQNASFDKLDKLIDYLETRMT